MRLVIGKWTGRIEPVEWKILFHGLGHQYLDFHSWGRRRLGLTSVSRGSQQLRQVVRVVGFKGDERIAEGGEKREEQNTVF